MNNEIMNEAAKRHQRRKRAMHRALLVMLVLTLVLPLSGYFYVGSVSAQSGAGKQSGAEKQTNPRADYWRDVRQGMPGYTAVTGQETGVLIQDGGEEYRQLRNGAVVNVGAVVLPLVLLAIGLFFVWRGKIKLEHGKSGQVVERWSLPERVMHWYTATLFVILSVTGLSLLYGRAVLIPVLGLAGFAAYAEFAKNFHNYLGPFFVVGVLLIVISWIKYNLPAKEDLEWFKKGGGIVGNEHPSAGRVNAGEKIWFWIVCTVGLGVCVTGLILDFPNFEQTRGVMQVSQLLHAILGIGWIAVFFGHVYIGTVGTEGALEGMTTGYVDVNWAKQHHDLWYEDLKKRGVKPGPAPKTKTKAAGRAAT
jgi:formate dehydrogenase subunit gamma